MDKRTIIGIALIVVITLLMPFYQKWITGDRKPVPRPVQEGDSLALKTDTISKAQVEPPVSPRAATEKIVQDISTAQELESQMIAGSDVEKVFNIESKKVKIRWSTLSGANPLSWELKNYRYHLGGVVNLINDNSLKINFLNIDGKEINLNQYNWYTDYPDGKNVFLDAQNPSYTIEFYLPLENGRIIKKIRFFYDRYAFEMVLRFENLQNYIINRRYFVGWDNGLPTTEQNLSDDLNYSRAYTYMAEELINIDASDKYEEEDFNGRVDWAAVRTKYFLISIIPANVSYTNGVTIGGVKIKEGDQEEKSFNFAIDAQYEAGPAISDTFTVFLGPLDHMVLKKYDVDLQSLVMNKDWYERTFRWMGIPLIYAFEFLNRFIPNYGLVIIIFSILIKIILHPLTKKSYQSMSEMQFLQPKMTEMREKYKNDSQRLNREMMKLYKEHGVNPLGGCLPMLLQMPVLIALFIVFRSTIQLRGKPFALWINDLSAPDILNIGVSLPFIGDTIHVLPIIMGLTMIWQSKMSMTDPKQKMMIYFMPVFLIFIFYSLPSGLNLYYAIFNLLSMAQTRYIKKKTHPNGDQKPENAESSRQIKKGQPGKKRK
jgi:YidC/Oxa1 family membrane protein insertase